MIYVCILPHNDNIQNDQRQDWKDDIEQCIQTQDIDIHIPVISPLMKKIRLKMLQSYFL